jgi:hypothetical protein
MYRRRMIRPINAIVTAGADMLPDGTCDVQLAYECRDSRVLAESCSETKVKIMSRVVVANKTPLLGASL